MKGGLLSELRTVVPTSSYVEELWPQLKNGSSFPITLQWICTVGS